MSAEIVVDMLLFISVRSAYYIY